MSCPSEQYASLFADDYTMLEQLPEKKTQIRVVSEEVTKFLELMRWVRLPAPLYPWLAMLARKRK
jgi:hypothetical protein